MKFVSLHRSKSVRAHKGGEIVSVRDATEDEIAKHQELLKRLSKEAMQDTDSRCIVVFRLDPDWNKIWPKNTNSHQMAYKGIGFVAPDA